MENTENKFKSLDEQLKEAHLKAEQTKIMQEEEKRQQEKKNKKGGEDAEIGDDKDQPEHTTKSKYEEER